MSARFHKCFYIQNFRTVIDGPEVRTSNLRDRRWQSRSWNIPEFGMSQCTKLWDRRQPFRKFNIPTSGPSPTVPKIWRPNFGTVADSPEVWCIQTFLKPCWYKMMSKITFWSEWCHWNGKSKIDSLWYFQIGQKYIFYYRQFLFLAIVTLGYEKYVPFIWPKSTIKCYIRANKQHTLRILDYVWYVLICNKSVWQKIFIWQKFVNKK